MRDAMADAALAGPSATPPRPCWPQSPVLHRQVALVAADGAAGRGRPPRPRRRSRTSVRPPDRPPGRQPIVLPCGGGAYFGSSDLASPLPASPLSAAWRGRHRPLGMRNRVRVAERRNRRAQPWPPSAARGPSR